MVFPLVPPLVIAAALVAVGRVHWLRAILTLLTTTVLLIAVNQIRLAIVVGSMRAWGYQKGYERSHVLIGSSVTTVGLIAVTVLFLVLLVKRPSPRVGVGHA